MDEGDAWAVEGAVMPATHEVSLRPITDRDLPFLLEVYASTRQQELAGVPWTAEQKAEFIQMQFAAQHRHYQTHYAGATFDVVIWRDERVGRLYVHRRPEEIRIVDIALLPAYRGRGIGSLLLRTLVAESVASARPLTIHVERENRALEWYRRLGFELVHDEGAYLFMSRPPAPAANQVKIAS